MLYCPIVVVPYTDDDGNLMHPEQHDHQGGRRSDESNWVCKALDIAADFATCWGAELDVISASAEPEGLWTARTPSWSPHKDDLRCASNRCRNRILI